MAPGAQTGGCVLRDGLGCRRGGSSTEPGQSNPFDHAAARPEALRRRGGLRLHHRLRGRSLSSHGLAHPRRDGRGVGPPHKVARRLLVRARRPVDAAGHQVHQRSRQRADAVPNQPAGWTLTIGQTLPAGTPVKSVTLDGKSTAYDVVDTTRGREVHVKTSTEASHTVAVTTG